MATPLRVTLVQLGYGDDEPVADRTSRVTDLIRAVCGAPGPEDPPRLVVLPELWAPTGFGHQSWQERAEPLDGPTSQAMSALARECGIWLHAGSIVELLAEPGPEGKSLSNTSLFFSPDGLRIASYRKIHRFGFGSGEPKLMEAGEEMVGVLLPGRRWAGLSTCYDLRFPELYRRQLDEGAEVFIVPAAWPMPRVSAWTLLGRARAIENQCFVIACNTAGTHAGTRMGGHSQVVSPMGEVLAEAGEDEEILDVVIDLDAVQKAREAFPVLADRRL